MLLLVRHAVAEDDHPAGDGARGLTREGRAAFRQHAKALPTLVTVRAIATSPLVRAVQTAEILAEAYGLDEVVVRRELANEGGRAVDRLVALARELGSGWALVGHNPSLSEASARLLGVRSLPRFRKGAVVALGRRGDHYDLRFVAAIGRRVVGELAEIS